MANHEFISICSSRLKNLTDQTFDDWTVLGYAGSHKNKTVWWCICQCGNIKKVLANALQRHLIKSCGCRKFKHGISSTPRTSHAGEYRVFMGMWSRCTNPNNQSYPNYGGRGIAICEAWHIFDTFLADMGLRPTPAHTIERKDNDGPYAKDNCLWATRQVQNSNTRRNHRISYNGENRTLSEWSRLYGLKAHTVLARLTRGWSVEQTLATPPTPLNMINAKAVTFHEETHSIKDWSAITGIPRSTLSRRLNQGWTVEQALTQPSGNQGRHGRRDRLSSEVPRELSVQLPLYLQYQPATQDERKVHPKLKH